MKKLSLFLVLLLLGSQIFVFLLSPVKCEWGTPTQLTSTTSTKPSISGDGSKVAFRNWVGGNEEIFVINSDGSGLTQLSNTWYWEDDPSISGDGTKIAYDSEVGGSDREIVVVNSDGSGLTQLTSNTAQDWESSISGDGTKIAFSSLIDGDYEIFVVNSDGSGLTQLTSNTAYDSHPSINYDGSKIAFQSDLDGDYEIFVVNSDGSGLTQLTSNTAQDWGPSISGDGTKIAFSSLIDGDYEIFVVNSDGSGLTQLTSNTATDRYLCISGDGTKIAFESDVDGDNEIFVVNIDGTGLTQLTHNTADDVSPSISGDGTKIAFQSDVGGSDRIFLIMQVVDSTLPIGSISINSGAATTYSRNVTLTLSASDPESGVTQMRLSNDGSTWFGWEPYITSKSWTLTEGDGTKTVFVQYKNGEGLVSESFLDLIVLNTTSAVYYDLTIDFDGSGYVNPYMGLQSREEGSEVEVTAVADSGWSFSYWTLDSVNVGSANPYTVTMDTDHSIVAHFVEETPLAHLTFAVTGSGSINFVAGVSVNGALGTYTFYADSVIYTTAVPDSDWSFDHWLFDGINVGSSNPYSVTINDDHVLTAVFTENPPEYYDLTISIVGSGVTSPSEGIHTYEEGTEVEVTVTGIMPLSSGYSIWTFSHWLLDSVNVGSANPYTVTMNSDHSLTAVFEDSGSEVEPVMHSLTVSVIGSGTTDPQPGTGLYFEENTVVITAYPDSGWTLDYWLLDGHNVGSSASYSLTMTANHVLTAVFKEVDPLDVFYDLSIQVQGSGTTDPPPGEYQDYEGTPVTVNAFPDENCTLDHWLLNGNNAGTEDSLSFTLDKNYTVVAVFSSTETQPPAFHDPTINPEQPSSDKDVTITFSIDSDVGVESVTLIYSVGGAEWETVPMTFDWDLWTANIPKQNNGEVIEFYAACYDYSGYYAESESYTYKITEGGIDWVPLLPIIIIPPAVGGFGLLWWKGKIPHFGKKLPPKHVGRTDLKAETKESDDKRKRKKKEKKAKLEWDFNSPTMIRSGGSAYAYGKVTNIGEGKAEDVQIKVKGPTELKPTKPLMLGDIEKGQSKNVKIKIECNEDVSETKDTIMYSLESKGIQSQTVVRSISFRYLKVGLLADVRNLEYLKKENLAKPSGQLSSWLKTNRFNFGVVSDAENLDELMEFDVLLASGQYALSDKAVANLRQYVKSGRGLVALDAIGHINADAYLEGKTDVDGAKRIYDFLGYDKPDFGKIERGLKGIRIVQNVHPITNWYERASIVKLPSQSGVAFKSPGSVSKVLADQRVAMDGRSGFAGTSALTAGSFGAGRIVHFNFDAEKALSGVAFLVEQALLWAGKIE